MTHRLNEMHLGRVLNPVTVSAAAFAAGTAWVGWCAVPVAGAAFGVLVGWRYRHPGRLAALGAVLGWGAILAIAIFRGAPLAVATRQLAQLAQTPVWVLPLVTLLYPAALAGCAAVVGASLARSVIPKAADHA